MAKQRIEPATVSHPGRLNAFMRTLVKCNNERQVVKAWKGLPKADQTAFKKVFKRTYEGTVKPALFTCRVVKQ